MAAYDPSGLPDMSDEQPGQNGEYTNPAEIPGEDDDDDYDPTSFNFGPSTNDGPADSMQVDAKPEPSQAELSSKPKTKGGFIIEESDDDEEEEDRNAAPPPSQLNGTEGTQSGLGAVAVSEAASAAAAQDVPLASEPTQDSAAAQNASAQQTAASLNGSTATPIIDSASAVPAFDASSSAVSQPAASLTAATQQKEEGKQDIVSSAAAGSAGTAFVAATPKPSVNATIAPSDSSNAVPQTPTSARLPHDKVGRLEDRIRDDPKADINAWWELIQHYRDKDQLDNARVVFQRMLEVWPTSPKIYLAYLAMEYPLFDRQRIDTLFSTSLPTVPNLQLWTHYLSYLRRVFPLLPDPQGQNRAVVTQAFDAVLDTVGGDPDSAPLWKDYIDFVKSGPGSLDAAANGRGGWQDLQKVDLVRKAFQRSVKMPSGEVVKLWKEYDAFEMGNNKQAGRKMLQEMSPHYMTARTAAKQLEGLTIGLHREGMAILPPLVGCEGDENFEAQILRWQGWLTWEKTDPLVLKDEDVAAYRNRIIFVYKQACINLRFWPTIWYEAAEWCFEELSDDMTAQGESFLDEGMKANPESVLLTLKKADRVEEGFQTGNGSDEIAVKNGGQLDAVFEGCHKALYELVKKMAERRERNVTEVREYFASLPPEDENEQQASKPEDDEDDDEPDADTPAVEKLKTRAEQLQDRLQGIQLLYRDQLDILKRTISYVWVAKMRAFRRIQGQGAPNKPKKGFRGVFAEARPRGQLSADVYVASALMEWHCYKDASALKIFERGLKLFPTDEGYALEYIKHLISVNDLTNARVVFETTVTKITGPGPAESVEQQKRDKVRPLLLFMHGFESQYGDLAQVRKLEGRMKEFYVGEPEIARFSQRYELGGFDGMGVELILSPSQARPKTSLPVVMGRAMPAMEVPGTIQAMADDGSLRLGPNGPYVASPKRPLDEDTDMDGTPRKFMRAESPLKGAAGRRVQGHTATNSVSGTLTTQMGGGASGFMTKNYVPATSPAFAAGSGPPPASAAPSGPAPLPREVTYLLSILPPAARYTVQAFNPGAVVDLLRRTDLEAHRGRVVAMQGYGGGGYGVPR